MATNIYVNTNREAGSKDVAGAVFPGQVLCLQGTYEKTASDNDTSVLRLGKVPSNAVPMYHKSFINNDALTGATDIDIGIYKPNNDTTDGAVVDKDLLSDGLNIAAGNALASPAKAFQTQPAIDKFGTTLLALTNAVNGTTLVDEEFDIAITGNTFGTATGTISWELYFLLPQA